jgi:hypothetical protein
MVIDGSPGPALAVTNACSIPILIVNADLGGPPTVLQSDLSARPSFSSVNLFDAATATPTLGQLTPYPLVVVFSNNAYANPVAMGDVLADYQDAGGVVVALNFNWFGPPFGLAGRWMTGGYTPYNTPGANAFTDSTLGVFTAGHPLMNGVTTLNAHFRQVLTLTGGTTLVASWNDGQPLIAEKGKAVGVNAYIGENPHAWSGDFAKVVENAALSLIPACLPTPTPTATPTATPCKVSFVQLCTTTPTITSTATTGPSSTPTATPTITATVPLTNTPTTTPTVTVTRTPLPGCVPSFVRRC